MKLYLIIALILFVFICFKFIDLIKVENTRDTGYIAKRNKKYIGYDLLSGVLFVFFFGIFLYLFYKSGNFVNRLIYPDDNNSLFFRPDDIIWSFPGILLAISLSSVPLYLIFKMVLKDEFERYMKWSSKVHKYSNSSLNHLRSISKVFLVITTAIFFLLNDVYFKVSDESLIINKFLSFQEKVIPLAAIDQIGMYENTDEYNRDKLPHIVVFYVDKVAVWSNDHSLYKENPRQFNPLIEILKSKYKTPVVYYPAEEESL